MADQKLTQLTQATTPLTGTEQVYVVQSSTSKRTTAQQVANLAPGTDLTFTQSTRVLASSTGADVTLPLATDALPGLMAAADKLKLDGVAAGATLNSSDATLLARANHTGTQPASTISDSTAAGRALLTAADTSAQRTALGLGTLATQSGTFSGTSSGTNSGDVSLSASVADVLGLNGQEVTADDPGADRLIFWDDSAGKLTHLTLGTNLSITGTTLDASGGGSTNASDLTSGTLSDARLSAKVMAAVNVTLWSNFR